ncbi:MAG: TonB-dependent receptor [Acidobacteriaceae bacterium]|nr:TonB-dependent receptor [Acidobacteriaceae bacterium]
MKFRFNSIRTGLAVLFLLTLASTFVWAQRETGQVVGTVRDPSGAVVPGVTITVTSMDQGFSRSVSSNNAGVYRITNLLPGNYEVSISQPGFTQFKQRVQVTVGSANTVDAHLAVKGAGTTVEVTAEGGAQVNTSDQSISQIVSSTQITQLPTLTRNPYDLVGISGNAAPDPTIVGSAGLVRGGGFNLNGQRNASNNILLDGGENRDEFTAQVGMPVPLDSVQEFRVVTSDFTAEYGRASGGVINVATKAGTNSFHGSLYEFNRISDLAANSYQNNATGQPQPRFVRNQFGYSIGGPIIKDKVFFFNSIEWTRVRGNVTTQGLVPTPQFLALTAPNTQAFFNALGSRRSDLRLGPTVTTADLQASGNALTTSTGLIPAGTPVFQQVTFNSAGDSGGGLPQNTYFGVLRADWNVTDKTSFYARYAGDHENQFPGTVSTSPFNGFETGTNVLNQNIMLNLTHTLTPSIVSQSKFAYNRLSLNQPLGAAGIVPGLFPLNNVPFLVTGLSSVAGSQFIFLPGYLPLSPANALPFGGPQNLYQAYEDISWTRGNHNFRVGGQYVHIRDNRTFGAFETGFETLGSPGNLDQVLSNMVAGQLFQFQAAIDPQGKFPCFADRTTGRPIVTPSCSVTLPVSQPNFSRNNRYNDAAVYFQDSWKFKPNFTINLGVRWEYYGVQHNANPNLDSNFYPANNGNGPVTPADIANGQTLIASQSPVGGLWDKNPNNWAPRIGFAWDIFGNGKSSIRGGYGISYERNFGNVTFNVIQNPPATGTLSIRPADVGTPIPINVNNLGPASGTSGTLPLNPFSLRAVDPHISTAYAHFYSLAFEHQLANNTVVALEYTGSRGLHQYSISSFNNNGGGVVYLGLDPAVVLPTTRLQTQYSNINWRGSDGDSYYNAFNVRVQSSNFASMGLTLTANYTWAHAIDDLSTTFSEVGTSAINLGFTDPFHPALDRGNADFDIRHRVTFSAIYEPPIGRDSTGWKRQVMGGWTVAPIFSAYTGNPYSVYDCTNAFNNCPRYTPADPNAAIPTLGDANVPTSPNTFTYLTLPTANSFNSNLIGISDFGQCTTPGEGNIGTTSVIGGGTLSTTTSCPFPSAMTRRNAFRGPNHWNLDFAAYKSFKVTERFGLQFRGEAFNVFNHANTFIAGAQDIFSNGGAFVVAKKGGLGLNPAFDTRERRNMQLGVKLTF